MSRRTIASHIRILRKSVNADCKGGSTGSSRGIVLRHVTSNDRQPEFLNTIEHGRTCRTTSTNITPIPSTRTQHSNMGYRYFSADASPDPTELQYEFNQMMNELSTKAFDLSFQQLEQTFDALEEKIKGMETHAIAIQNDRNYLHTIQKLMSSCAQCGTVAGAELAERYLTLVLNSNVKGQNRHGEDYSDAHDLGPTRQMFTIAMDAWGKIDVTQRGSSREALMPAQRAQQILDFMWEEYNKNMSNNTAHDAVKPDVIHYTTVLQAFANASSRRATQLAQNLLKQAEKQSGVHDFINNRKGLTDLDPNLVPDRTCYNTVLYCLSRYFNSRDDFPGRAHSAQYIMGQMKEMMNRMEMMADKLNDDSWMPNTRTYNLLLMACSRGTNGGGVEAEKILQEMLTRSEHLVDEDLGLVKLEGDVDIEDLEENSVVPNIKSYNAVINAWSHEKLGRGPQRAEEILRALLRQVPQSSTSSIDITNHPLLSIIYPDVVTFNLTINAWARSELPQAGERAEAILNFMSGKSSSKSALFLPENDMKISLDELNIVPDVISFNSAINAWCKSGHEEGAYRAQQILDRLLMESGEGGELMPNSISFSTAMNAWAQSSDPNCGSKAETLFERQLTLYEERNNEVCRPSESSFRVLVSAWCNEAAKSGKEETFDKALKAMVRMQREGGFLPKTAEYNLLLSVPSKIQANDDMSRYNIAMKARAILMEMLENDRSSGSAPDIYSFNYVIKGFQGYNEEDCRRESLFAVIDAFNMLCETETCNANDQTYIHMFKAIQDSLAGDSQERAGRIIEEIFRKCCESGLLTNAVLRTVANMLPSQSLQRLEACRTNDDSGPLAVNNLPSEWSENRRVGQNQRRDRKR